MLFLSLSRCPVCREQATSSLGCCLACQQHLFQPQSGDTWLSLGIYQGKLEKAVRAYKFHHATRLSHLFAQQMSRCLEAQTWHIDTICAVPLHWTRYLERGYNQSALIAKKLALQQGLPYQPLLRRTRRTRQQAKLSKADRLHNVQDAFLARPFRGSVLLIDDVITSGATSQACIDTLLKAGAKEVKVAAIARAIPTAIRS